jgi:hypothetical protein
MAASRVDGTRYSGSRSAVIAELWTGGRAAKDRIVLCRSARFSSSSVGGGAQCPDSAR